MELRHLRYFIAVAENSSFSKAAKQLHMAQPPLSYEISILEKELHTRLIDRSTRPIKLTESGKFFYKKAINILQEIENTCKDTHQIDNGIYGSITIGFTGSVIFDIIPKSVHLFNTIYPSIRLHLLQLSTAEQIERLQNNTIDIGFLCSVPNFTDLCSKIIIKEPFMLALPANHYLSTEIKPIDLRRLHNEHFITTYKSFGEYYYNTIERLFLINNLRPKIVQEVSNLLTIMAFIKSGLGISIVPKSIQNFDIKDIIFKEIKNTKYLTTVAVWKKDTDNFLIYKFIKLLFDTNNHICKRNN